MDRLDKQIITRLLGNCRESYRSIGRRYGVTCPTITYRVDNLRQMGVIQRFVAEISQETLGVDWVMAELHTESDVSKLDLLTALDENECVGDVFVLDGGRYLIFAEVYPEERENYSSCLKRIDGVTYAQVNTISALSSQEGSRGCKYLTRGERVSLSPTEIDLLRLLVWNARVPLKTLSKQTGLGQKAIRKYLQKFVECDGVHLTLKLNLIQCGEINLILKTQLDDIQSNPIETAQWVHRRYPQEHWFTFHVPNANQLIHYMTLKHLIDIDGVVRDIKAHNEIDGVEVGIVYNSFKRDGRTLHFLARCDEEEQQKAVERKGFRIRTPRWMQRKHKTNT